MTIGIESRRATKAGRFYEIVKGDPWPSVTTIEDIIAKFQLYMWYAKQERLATMAVAGDMFEELSKPLVISTGMTRETYLALLESRLGKQKAGQREMQLAGEIGTQAHEMVEWHVRKLLGLKVGPQPKISEKAMWAFMAFEDWARSVDFLPLRSEQVVFSHKYRYAGTMDLLAWIANGKSRELALIDIKTSSGIWPEMKLQLAAYRWALMEMKLEKPDRCLIVRLPKKDTDPEFEVAEVTDLDRHFEAFLAARQLWQWKYDEDQKRRGE